MILTLLSGFAIMQVSIPMTSSFVQRQRKTQKSFVAGISEQQIGKDICDNILFIHAILGCDTTSRLYGIGKGTSLSKFKASNMFREQAQMFNSDSVSTNDVIDAGEKALVLIYNGKLPDNLDSL